MHLAPMIPRFWQDWHELSFWLAFPRIGQVSRPESVEQLKVHFDGDHQRNRNLSVLQGGLKPVFH